MSTNRMRIVIDPAAEGHVEEAVVDFMRELGKDISDAAKRIVPFVSGDLHDSIGVEIDDPNGGAVVMRVGSNLDYALAIEKGRADIPNFPVQPYLAPALYQVRG